MLFYFYLSFFATVKFMDCFLITGVAFCNEAKNLRVLGAMLSFAYANGTFICESMQNLTIRTHKRTMRKCVHWYISKLAT